MSDYIYFEAASPDVKEDISHYLSKVEEVKARRTNYFRAAAMVGARKVVESAGGNVIEGVIFQGGVQPPPTFKCVPKSLTGCSEMVMRTDDIDKLTMPLLSIQGVPKFAVEAAESGEPKVCMSTAFIKNGRAYIAVPEAARVEEIPGCVKVQLDLFADSARKARPSMH